MAEFTAKTILISVWKELKMEGALPPILWLTLSQIRPALSTKKNHLPESQNYLPLVEQSWKHIAYTLNVCKTKLISLTPCFTYAIKLIHDRKSLLQWAKSELKQYLWDGWWLTTLPTQFRLYHDFGIIIYHNKLHFCKQNFEHKI